MVLPQVQKGSVVVFLRFDSINQIVFDDAEPRSILISCRDERRYGRVKRTGVDWAPAWHVHMSLYTHHSTGMHVYKASRSFFCATSAHSSWLLCTLVKAVLTTTRGLYSRGNSSQRHDVLLVVCVAGFSLSFRVLRTTWCSGPPVQTWLPRAWTGKGGPGITWHAMTCCPAAVSLSAYVQAWCLMRTNLYMQAT